MDAIIVTNASAKEIAALVLAVQERQYKNGDVPADIIRRVFRSTIDDTQTNTTSQ